jgi:hypothetical protein
MAMLILMLILAVVLSGCQQAPKSQDADQPADPIPPLVRQPDGTELMQLPDPLLSEVLQYGLTLFPRCGDLGRGDEDLPILFVYRHLLEVLDVLSSPGRCPLDALPVPMGRWGIGVHTHAVGRRTASLRGADPSFSGNSRSDLAAGIFQSFLGFEVEPTVIGWIAVAMVDVERGVMAGNQFRDYAVSEMEAVSDAHPDVAVWTD